MKRIRITCAILSGPVCAVLLVLLARVLCFVAGVVADPILMGMLVLICVPGAACMSGLALAAEFDP